MTNKMYENNKAVIMGKIVSGFTFDHEAYGEGFYMMYVEVSRFSEACDTIPVLVSERLVDVNEDYQGAYVSISGQFRSYNRHEEKRIKLILFVFASEIRFITEPERSPRTNQIYLDGYVCKEPIYRKTPMGNRDITELFFAVNRFYGKTDYIPCICWGRTALYAGNFRVGTHCAVWGRIQSREYQKKISDEQFEKRMAYELSICKLEFLDEPKVENSTL